MAKTHASGGANGTIVPLLRWITALALALGLSAAATAQAANLRQYAVLVLDAKTGQVIHSRGGDATRYPASVAKVMTLYVLFEELAAGRLSLNSPLTVSRHAANAQPSKLNLRPGQTISVENAILALVTKSANDVARVVAEGISGTESAFAERMTRTARALGMSRTTYRNASGLPDSGQTTTVRDQARLGAAIYQHFPQYYHYFQTRSFTYGGQRYGNHNRLLGENGVDGLKTGYIRASGFNLLTSARRDDRHLVIAAFGFDSSSARDARVRELVRKYLPDASAGDIRTAALIPRPNGGSVFNPTGKPLDGVPPRRPARFYPQPPVPTGQPLDDVVLASFDPNAPTPPARPVAQPLPTYEPVANEPMALLPVATESAPDRQFAPADVLGNFIDQVFGGSARAAQPTAPPPTQPALDPAPTPGGLVPPAEVGAPLTTGSIGATPVSTAPVGGWAVQVGASSTEAGANQLLTQAGDNLAELSDYRTYVQRITRDGQAFYRARFIGFADRSDASAMCEVLKQRQINCLAMPG